jgi:hypothetical protein
MITYYLWTAFCDEVSFSSNRVSNHKVGFATLW